MMIPRKRHSRLRRQTPASTVQIGVSENTPAPAVGDAPLLAHRGHDTFRQRLQNLSALGTESAEWTFIDAVTGVRSPADDRNGAALPLNEQLADNLTRRLALELSNENTQFSAARLLSPGCRVPSRDGSIDLTRIYSHARQIKALAANSVWIPVPAIVMAGGEEMLEWALEGIMFEEGLNDVLADRISELAYRLNRASGENACTTTPIRRDVERIARRIRAMFCVSVRHLPRSSGDAEQDARAAHRLLHVRSMMEVRQMTKFDTGEGRVHQYAALNATRAGLPDRVAARSSGAPKTRRARDIAHLMRVTGFVDYELPYIRR